MSARIRGGWAVSTMVVVVLVAACQSRHHEAEPAQAVAPADTLPPIPTALDTGRVVYLGNCAMCHGMTGSGNGPLAAEFARQGAKPPAPLADHARLERLGREGLLDVIGRGGRHTGRAYLVPPWSESLEPPLPERAADYVLTLADTAARDTTHSTVFEIPSPAGATARGRELYASLCTPCHGPGGKGDGTYARTLWLRNGVRPGDLTDSVNFARKDNRDLAAALALGGGHLGRSMYMPAWNYTLSATQIQDLVGYVRALSRTPAGPTP